MNLRLPAAVVVTAALAVAAPAGQAAQVKTPTQRIAALEKQVAALQKQTKRLSGEISANYFGDACLSAITADALQGTWTVVNQFAGRALFTVGAAVSDKQGCQLTGATRSAGSASGFLTALTTFINWLV